MSSLLSEGRPLPEYPGFLKILHPRVVRLSLSFLNAACVVDVLARSLAQMPQSVESVLQLWRGRARRAPAIHRPKPLVHGGWHDGGDALSRGDVRHVTRPESVVSFYR